MRINVVIRSICPGGSPTFEDISTFKERDAGLPRPR